MKRYILLLGAILIGFVMRAQSVTYICRYWFDQNFAQAVMSTFSDNTWQAELDVGMLPEGLHTLHLQMADTSMKWNAPESFLFVKAQGSPSENITYHYWFDQNFGDQQTGLLGSGNFLLDVADLDEGLHVVNIMLQDGFGALTTTKSYMFIKVAVQDISDELHYHCWFDEDYSTVQTGVITNGVFLLDVAELSSGLHKVNVQVNNGSLTAPQNYLFYKMPVGGEGIARWQYWINGDTEHKHTTDLLPTLDTLDILSLLPVETWPIRSSCFHFHPNGENPYLNAKNEITFRFWSTDNHVLDKSAFYVDENVEESIVSEVFERNTTDTILAPRDNQIHWFKLDAVVGDSLSFIASKACTMQLFAPSGEEVYNVSGPESVVLGGLHAWEDGTYYLAVHDVTGNGETVSVTYNWVYRYAILAYNVHQVGNGGCSTITFAGNGYNSLLDVYLVNAQNDTIRRLDIGHESNTTTTVTFNFYEVNLGVYDAVFEFYDETIRINGALEVEDSIDIFITASASYPHSFLNGTEVAFSFIVTNNGNMSAYAIPIYLYITSPELEDIAHIELEGLNLPSLLDYIENVDWDTIDNVVELRQIANEYGDEHYFYRNCVIKNYYNQQGIRSNYFFIDLGPNESKTINLRMIASTQIGHQDIGAYLTVPNEKISPYNPDYGGSGTNSSYCCVQNKIQCALDIVCDAMDVGDVFDLGSDIASCICGILQNSNSVIGDIICEGESPMNAFRNMPSFGGTVLSCASAITGAGRIKAALQMANKALGLWTLSEMLTLPAEGRDIGTDVSNCVTEWTKEKPGCPPGDPVGGKADCVHPGDPNNIFGYLSESDSHYMMQEIQNIHYEIEFENDTTLATAAAHTIIVRDTLDAAKFDLNSLAARSVTIGDKRLELNGEQTFARTLDLRPEIYVIAQIEQDYDPTTGIVEWTIQSLDPMTMEPTDDPNQGVLPVNYNGNGVGFIDYSINLKEAFADGTEISNRAGIIFDQEEVIMTPTWTNTIDAVKPTSHIEEVTPVADSLSFSFVSEDNRSGVWYHSLYYRNDSTQMQWQVKKPQITENSLMLFFDDFQTTEYLVMAVDSAGNVEEKDMVAEYTYYYEGLGPASQTNTLTQGWNWWSTYVEMNNVDGLGMLQNSLGHNGLTIKSQNDFTDNYYQDMGEDYWYGSLESIHNEQGYLINVADACSVTMTGSAAIPALHPITIQPNWNWIGYPVAVPQTVANALSGFNPMPDDVVKGQSDFTSYYEGFGWYPDDFMLVPGQSYLYFSTANAGKTLTYANGSRGGALKSRKLGATYWNNNVHAFADNLSVMAVVKVDSIEQRDEHLELGAFVNGECRGSVRLRYFAPLDRYYAMLTVSGQDGDLVGFRLIHSESLEENETCASHLVFSKNAIVGSLGKPYEVRFGEVEDAMVDMVLYPNPVERGATFSLMIPSGETVTEVIITDVVGNQLRHETGAIDAKSIKGLTTAGVYVIKAVAKSGNTYHGRLIVE